jgi:hypothetical protein
MYTFTCKSVEDHGHCTTVEFVTADNNSQLSLFIYAGDQVPAVGDEIVLAYPPSAPGDLPADPPVVSHPPNTVAQDIPSQVGEAATDEQHAAGDVEEGQEESHSVGLGTSGDGAGALLPATQVNELLPAGVGGLDGVAPLPVVADTEVHQESTESPPLGIAPLGVNVAQEPVNPGDLQVNLGAVENTALSSGDALLSAEALGSTAAQ